MSSNKEEFEIDRLLSKVVEESISPEQAERLEQLLQEDSKQIEYYKRFIEIDVLLQAESVIPAHAPLNDLSHIKQKNDKGIIARPHIVSAGVKNSRWWYFLSIACAAAAVIATTVLVSNQSKNQIAKIVRSSDAVWHKLSDVDSNDTGLKEGDYINLSSGYIDLVVKNGVKLRIAGPAETILSKQETLILDRGKVVASVPSNAIGFTVETPITKVVDLGTVFGVAYQDDDLAKIAVFKGAVEATTISTGEGPTASNTVLLHEDECCVINQEKKIIGSVQKLSNSTIRDQFDGLVEVEVSLADMIAGGDGHGSAQGRGIDPTNGKATKIQAMHHLYESDIPSFHEVSSSRWIAGVFVPGGERGEAILDPTGNRFASRRLSGNESFGPFWVGAPAPLKEPAGLQGENRILTEFNGIEYGNGEYEVVFMHSNKGITFDLDAVREAHPNLELSRFSTLLANTEKSDETRPRDRRESFMAADFWVFVDGEMQSSFLNLNRDSGLKNVDVELESGDRFLTLMVGNGAAKTILDWVILIDPSLHLIGN